MLRSCTIVARIDEYIESINWLLGAWAFDLRNMWTYTIVYHKKHSEKILNLSVDVVDVCMFHGSASNHDSCIGKVKTVLWKHIILVCGQSPKVFHYNSMCNVIQVFSSVNVTVVFALQDSYLHTPHRSSICMWHITTKGTLFICWPDLFCDIGQKNL